MNTEKERLAILYLREFEPKDDDKGYYLCYSGGKDSDAIRILAQLAGVKHECKHSLTTVDAPESVRYVQRTIGRENIEIPPLSMWGLIVKKGMPPTRLVRYCCAELKERGGMGRLKITGVRAAESVSRAKNSGAIKIIGKPKTTQKAAEESGAIYRVNDQGGLVLNFDDAAGRHLVERCYRTTATMINPIIDWTDQDVWEFLQHYGCEGNPLYKCGFKRVGCIGCPMARPRYRKKEFAMFPEYRRLYVKAFDRMLESNEKLNRKYRVTWETGEDVMRWWLEDDPSQLTIEDFEEMALDAGESLDYWRDRY